MKPTAVATLRNLFLVALLVICPAVSADDYSSFITEDYLRSRFSFGASETLKYSQCEKKSYPTCTYIWGPESQKDAARINAGLAPAGSKLQIGYVQAASINDFERVLSSYTDAKPVAGIAETAVWSDQRKQLSFITETKLIVHIHIVETQEKDPEAIAVAIARHVIDQL